MVIQLLYIKQDVVIEQFSTECRKTKTKVITLANHKGCRAIPCPIKTRSNYTKCRKTCVSNSRLVLVLLVICFGLRKWREFSKPITKHSKHNTKVNAFDTQVKTALRNPIIRIIQSKDTIPLERFVKAAQTIIILSIIGILASWEPLGSHCKKSIGKIPERIERKWFNRFHSCDCQLWKFLGTKEKFTSEKSSNPKALTWSTNLGVGGWNMLSLRSVLQVLQVSIVALQLCLPL